MAIQRVRIAPMGAFATIPDTDVAPGQLLGRSLNAGVVGPAVPVSGAEAGELIRYQNEVPNSDTGTLAVLTIGEQTTAVQFNPVGSDLTIQSISIPFGKTCRLRVQRTCTQRVIIVNGSGANVARCPGQADFVMQANDECEVINSFGAPMIISESTGPTLLKPEVAPFTAAPNTLWSVPFLLRHTFAAGGGGAADDVTIIPAAALAFGLRVQDCWFEVATGVGGASVQLRNALGGVGSVLSSALAAVTPATTSRNAASAPPTLAAGTVLAARRSDSGVAGTIFALVSRV